MKHFSRKTLIFLIVLVLVFSAFGAPRQEAQAVGLGTIGGGILAVAQCTGLIGLFSGFVGGLFGGLLGSLITVPTSDSKVREATKSQETKDNCLDHLAWVAVNIAIEDATRETVDWINGDTGTGGPRYVQDVGGFLGNVADDVIGEYILGSPLGFVCDPFKTQLRISLARSRIPDRRVQCTLSEVVDNIGNAINVRGFVTGDFYEGGWDAWGELVTRSNPYTQYLNAENDIELRINARQDIELAKLEWGGGFFAWETCPGGEYGCHYIESDGVAVVALKSEAECRALSGSYQCARPLQTNTPGSVIESQLNKTLSSGASRLEVADEINEIISALLNKLIRDVFSPGGLRGLKNTQTLQGRTGSSNNNGAGACRATGICTPLASCILTCEDTSCQILSDGVSTICPTSGPAFNTLNSCVAQCATDFPLTPPVDPTTKDPICVTGCTQQFCLGNEGPVDPVPGGDTDSTLPGSTCDIPGQNACIAACPLISPGGGAGQGNDPGAPSFIDEANIIWIDRDISGWSTTANLSASVSGSVIDLNYDKADVWPVAFPLGGSDPVTEGLVANPWIVVWRKGNWYASTWEWMRPGQTSRDDSNLLGADGTLRGELSNFSPRTGDLYGFVVSGLARNSVNNVSERSNISPVIWTGVSTYSQGAYQAGYQAGYQSGYGGGGCSGSGFANHESVVVGANNAVLSANPTLANSLNTESNSFQFIGLVAQEIDSLGGFNGVIPLNGNGNPTTGDLVAIWANGETLMERYDIVTGAGAGDTTMSNAATTQFTGDIPLTCI